MIAPNFERRASQKAIENFNNIKKAIEGLYVILCIIAKTENEVFIKMGMDNLEAFYKNFLELIFNDYGLRRLMKQIKNFDLNLDIPLEKLTISKEIKDKKKSFRNSL